MKRLFPLLLLLISSVAPAESGAYRVQVIIFQNLAVVADATPIETLRSFSRYPALEEGDLPDDLAAVTQPGKYMDAVWKRLRSSKGYRPLLFAAWEQNRTDYYPPLRIHDETVLDEQLRPPTSIMIAELEAEDPLSAYLSTFYQLDGTVQLRRSRFLHLYLDLEYRQTAPQLVTQLPFFGFDNPGFSDGAGDSTGYINYSLEQNRQIRTGSLQYFDTPYFGALVFVSAIDSE